jgi:hypothetical protein
MKEDLKYLADAIDKKGLKVTFGLRPHHIEAIESYIKYMNELPIKSTDLPEPNMKFSKGLWDILGKKLGWCPFTLCLYYFEYLEDKTKT